MSWALASTVLVTACVAVGVAWFERTRPDARRVALIAAVAALAVAGRIAFAPIPGVKPTTDLVLLAGFVFGAAPGFVVGATTALISNVAFGQGLHTPWQMLGWGAVGILGAAVGRMAGKRRSPWALAMVCALAALAFSALLDLSVWAQTAPTHSVGDYAAISLRGAPFTAAHVIGSAIFAFAFGQIVVSSFTRAETRARVVWDESGPAPSG